MNQFRAHVLPLGIEAHGDDASVPVNIALLADDRPSGDEAAQRIGGLLPALDFGHTVPAPLFRFRCVDAMKPDALAGHVDGVAVNDPGRAGDALGQRWDDLAPSGIDMAIAADPN